MRANLGRGLVGIAAGFLMEAMLNQANAAAPCQPQRKVHKVEELRFNPEVMRQALWQAGIYEKK
jgi:hypothetical protein